MTEKVVPFSEVKEAIDKVKSDTAELRQQMQDDKAATALELEKRSDDLNKYMGVVDDIVKRHEKAMERWKQLEYDASITEGEKELRRECDMLRAGFKAHHEEAEMKAVKGINQDGKPEATIKHLIEGVVQGGEYVSSKHALVLELQKASDALYMHDSHVRAFMTPQELKAYEQRGGARSLSTFPRYKNLAERVQKAASDMIDTTAGVDAWLPTQYSASLYEKVKIGLLLAGMFPEVAMTAPSMVFPVDVNDTEAHPKAEVTSFSSADPFGDVVMNTFASENVTLTAQKIRARYTLSRESAEDSIVPLIPLLTRKLVRNLQEAIEDTVLNGDDSGGLDTGSTHFGFNNPQGTDAEDPRDLWDGLRQFIKELVAAGSTAISQDGGDAKATVTNMRAVRAAMGEYGVDPGALAWIFGIFGYVQLLDDSQVITIDKFGPQATVRTGTLASVDGTDIVVTRKMPENADATGIISTAGTGAGTRTMALLVHTMGAVMGVSRRITTGSQQFLSTDSMDMAAFWRGVFKSVYKTSGATRQTWLGQLYNIAAD